MLNFNPLLGAPRYDAWRFASGFEVRERVIREQTKEEKKEEMEREKRRLREWTGRLGK